MTLNIQQTNVSIGGNKMSATVSSTPRFVDTIFMLFSNGSFDHTCHLNPLFTDWQAKMGGYARSQMSQYLHTVLNSTRLCVTLTMLTLMLLV